MELLNYNRTLKMFKSINILIFCLLLFLHNTTATIINSTDPSLLAHVGDLQAFRAQQMTALKTAATPTIAELQDRIEQVDRLIAEVVKCVDRNITQPYIANSGYCPSVWDKASCWPSTENGSVAIQPCPLYIKGFYAGLAYKACNADGTWAVNNSTGEAWTDYRQCSGYPATSSSTERQNGSGGGTHSNILSASDSVLSGSTLSTSSSSSSSSLSSSSLSSSSASFPLWSNNAGFDASGDYRTPDLGSNFTGNIAERSRDRIRAILGHIRNFRLISTYGYSISLVSLLVACTILIKVKKLHCPRNSLHLHLFLSFIIRCTVYLIKSMLFDWDEEKINDIVSDYVGKKLIAESGKIVAAMSAASATIATTSVVSSTVASSMIADNNPNLMPDISMMFVNHTATRRLESESSMLENLYALTLDNSPAVCKLLTIIWQYSLVANYFWVLMEGFYLYNIMFTKIFNDNSNILVYVLLGWGSPIPIILAWSVLRLAYDDTFCWENNGNNEYIFWITRGPITASIIINFYFFIRIAAVIFSKMFPKSSSIYSSKNYKYRSWFKSTLVLMPLFGIHHTFLLIFHEMTLTNTPSEYVWLYFDLSFSTLQGCLVSILYCFWCADVRYEVKKFLSKFSMSQLIFWSPNTSMSESSSARHNVHLQVLDNRRHNHNNFNFNNNHNNNHLNPNNNGSNDNKNNLNNNHLNRQQNYPAQYNRRQQLIVDRNGNNKLNHDSHQLMDGQYTNTVMTATSIASPTPTIPNATPNNGHRSMFIPNVDATQELKNKLELEPSFEFHDPVFQKSKNILSDPPAVQKKFQEFERKGLKSNNGVLIQIDSEK